MCAFDDVVFFEFCLLGHIMNTKPAHIVAATRAFQNIVEVAEAHGTAEAELFILLAVAKEIHVFTALFVHSCVHSELVALEHVAQV